MSRRAATAGPDLGALAGGVVLDRKLWRTQDEVRPVRPRRVAWGTVDGVYPFAPDVVDVTTHGGEPLTIRLSR